MRLIILFLLAIAVNGQQNLSSPTTILPTPSGAGELRVRTVESAGAYYLSIKANPTMAANEVWVAPAANATGVLQNDGAGNLSWVSGGTLTVCGMNTQILFASGSTPVCGASANLTWSGATLTVTGISANPAILVPGGSGYIQSDGGVYSNANLYNGFFSNTDGIVVPGFGVSTDGQTGGYFDYPQLVYPPSGSSACYDAYGNLATFPNGLSGATFASYAAYNSSLTYAKYDVVTSGGSAYYAITSVPTSTPPPNAGYWAPIGGIIGGGLSDVIVWNGPSPLQGYVGGSPYHIDGTPCAAPPLTNPLNGLNVSSYVFARYGFATDTSSSVAIQAFTGGMQAESYYAGALYYAGTVTHCCGTISSPQHLGGYMVLNATTGVPGGGTGCTSISSCNNPLLPGEGVGEGMFYEESSTHHAYIYDASSWRELVYYNDTPTFVGVAATGSAYNEIQAPSGGLLAGLGVTTGQALYPFGQTCTSLNSPASGYGGLGWNSGSNYCYWNGTAWATVNLSSSGGGGYWTASGSNIYNSNSGNVGINNASPPFRFDVSGHFDVDDYGNVTLTGTGAVISINGSSGGVNVTADTNTNSIQTIGGYLSYTSGSGNCANLEQTYVASYTSCNTGEPVWRLATSGGSGLLSLNNGTGSGGLDGFGAQVYATSSGTSGQLGATLNVYAGILSGERSFINAIGLGTTNSSNVGTFEVFAPTGAITTYEGYTTSGPGVAWIMGTGQIAGLTGNSSSSTYNLTSFTPPAGSYVLNAEVIQTGGTSGCSTQPSFQVDVAIIDPTISARLIQVFFVPWLTATGQALSGTFVSQGASMMFRNTSSVPTIQWSSFGGVGCSNFGTFGINYVLEYVGN